MGCKQKGKVMRSNHINFTEKGLAALAVPEWGAKPVTYYDTGTKAGLCVIVTYGGTKTYYFLMKFNGRTTRIKIGKVGEVKLFEARKQAEDMRHMAAHGEQPTNKRQIDLKDISLKAFFEQYYKPNHSDVFKKRNSQLADQRLFNNTLVSLHNRKLLSITRGDIELLHIALKKNIGIHTANRMLSLVRHMYNKAIEWGIIPRSAENPAIGIKKFPEKSRDRFMSGDEICRFFKVLEAIPNDVFRNYVLLSLLIGQRRSDILALRWSDIDFENGQAYFAAPKNGEPIRVPLSTQATHLLRQMHARRTSDWLFPSQTSASGHYEEPKKAWKNLLELAGIENLRLHDLRRTLGSYEAIAGASLHIIGKSLGHKSPNSTMVYARLDNDPVREAIQKATDKMMSFVEPSSDSSL